MGFGGSAGFGHGAEGRVGASGKGSKGLQVRSGRHGVGPKHEFYRAHQTVAKRGRVSSQTQPLRWHMGSFTHCRTGFSDSSCLRCIPGKRKRHPLTV
jgi:hypothetical protein